MLAILIGLGWRLSRFDASIPVPGLSAPLGAQMLKS